MLSAVAQPVCAGEMLVAHCVGPDGVSVRGQLHVHH